MSLRSLVAWVSTCLSLALLLGAPDAHAGSYVGTSTDPITLKAIPLSGGTHYTRNTSGQMASLPDNGDAQSYGGTSGGGGQNQPPTCSGTISASWKWTPTPPMDMTTDPPPSQVIVMESCTASATVSTPISTGKYDTGMGKSGSVSWSGNHTGSATSVRYSVQTGGPSLTLTPSVLPKSSGTQQGDGCSVSYSVTLYPIFITPGGITLISGAQEALTGQPLTASLAALPSGYTASNYQWDIESEGGGSVCGGYIAEQALGMTTSVAPFNNPTITFYDGIQDTVTINLSVTITFPDKTTSSATATTQVIIQKPIVTTRAFSINGSNTFIQHPNDTGSALGASEVWAGVTITMPTGFSGGSGCFAQILMSTVRDDSRHTGSDYTIKEKLSNGQWIAIPAPCLDTDFPYPYANQWTVGASGASGQGTGGDSPYFPVSPALDLGDAGQADWYKADGHDNFLTWIMYNPNPQSSSNIWVPLANFDWSWKNTASLNTSLTPKAWQAGTFSGDDGTDYAPTGQWPMWNTWIPFAIINNNPTGTIAMHE